MNNGVYTIYFNHTDLNGVVMPIRKGEFVVQNGAIVSTRGVASSIPTGPITLGVKLSISRFNNGYYSVAPNTPNLRKSDTAKPIKPCPTCKYQLTTTNAPVVGEQDVHGIPAFEGKKMMLHNCPKCGSTVAYVTPIEESLEKGQKGDWKQEGYTFTHDNDKGFHTVSARTKTGELAGIFNFLESKKYGTLKPEWANVGDEHKRKGLASEAYRMIQKNTGKTLLPGTIQTSEAESLWTAKDKFIKTFKKSLQKGALRLKAPFNPRKEGAEHGIDTAVDWVSGNDSGEREILPAMTGAAKLRGLNKLRAVTQVRKNPATGATEFLLHRGMSEDEATGHKNGAINTRTSWTPHKSIAQNFASPSVVGYSSGLDGGHVASAWIPEDKIHSMPYMLGSDPNIQDYRDEQEVVVAPHNTNIASLQRFGTAQKISDQQKLTGHLSLKDNKTLIGREAVKEKMKQNIQPPIAIAKKKPKV